jgi:hypothetical protein
MIQGRREHPEHEVILLQLSCPLRRACSTMHAMQRTQSHNCCHRMLEEIAPHRHTYTRKQGHRKLPHTVTAPPPPHTHTHPGYVCNTCHGVSHPSCRLPRSSATRQEPAICLTPTHCKTTGLCTQNLCAGGLLLGRCDSWNTKMA